MSSAEEVRGGGRGRGGEGGEDLKGVGGSGPCFCSPLLAMTEQNT